MLRLYILVFIYFLPTDPATTERTTIALLIRYSRDRANPPWTNHAPLTVPISGFRLSLE